MTASAKLFVTLPEPIEELSTPAGITDYVLAFTKSGVWLVYRDGHVTGPHFGPGPNPRDVR